LQEDWSRAAASDLEGKMKIVIVGAGPAGVTTAETIRSFDRSSQLDVISAEPYAPYSPPAMADHFIHDSNVHLWRGDDWPEQWGINYWSGAQVVKIDPISCSLWLADGKRLNYDKLVIATGSSLYAPVQGADLPGVYNFKSLSSAESLVKRVKTGEARTALIVGAGFIGMEIGLLLRELGVAVTQIEMLDQVMPAMLDPNTAAIALNMMQQHGVEVRLRTRALAFQGNGSAASVRLETGENLKADILIAATGIRPNLEFLKGSGIDHAWGITVNDHMQTNYPDIYAAGDVAETPDRLTGETYVHAIFPNAVEQGRVVGLNILGYDVTYDGADRMNSLKHLGLPIMAAGLKNGDEVLQAKGKGFLRTLYFQENRLVGFQLVGDIRSAGIYRTLMNQRQDLSKIKDRLLEPGFGQGSLVFNALA
jgi:nitrite reductase (NADH) large subunit